MNHEQFKIWEKQKRKEYGAELIKLQENLAGRGLAFSGMRNKEEENLKAKYESEIEIARLDVTDNDKDMYSEILKWANNKTTFNLQELYNRFPILSNSLKEWFLKTFRGASDNDDCLIGLGYDDNRSDYYYLTAKGKLAYSNSSQNQIINIEKMETNYGDKINGDKIEQHGQKNNTSIKKLSGENFLGKLFWKILAFLLTLVAAYIIFQLGWN